MTTVQLLKRTPRTARTDEHLTFFTTVEAAEFRRLVEASFARAGRDVTIEDDHVEDRTGTTFGLWNIAALCRGVDRPEWPDVIDEHVRSVTTPPQGLSELSRDELETGLHLRLVEARSVPDPDELGYARQVAPGLLEVLSVDLPDSVATLERADLTALGTTGELVELGRANLRSLLGSDDVAAAPVADAGGVSFTTVTGASFFTASLALLLPETVKRFSREPVGARGVLVAVPHRHELLYRVLDEQSTGSSLRRMFELARRGFYDGPGPVSPNVYCVRDRRWLPVTSVDGARPRVLVRGERYPA